MIVPSVSPSDLAVAATKCPPIGRPTVPTSNPPYSSPPPPLFFGEKLPTNRSSNRSYIWPRHLPPPRSLPRFWMNATTRLPLRSTTIKGRPPRAVPQTPSGRGQPPAGRVTRSAMKAKPVALPAMGGRQSRAVPSTPSGRGRPPCGRTMRSAIKARPGGYEAPTPTIESKVGTGRD